MMYRLLWLFIMIVFSSQINLGIAQSSFPDTVVSPASVQYYTSFLGRLIMGSNYRKVWATPVAMPVFDIKTSGFTIKELGGGMQTKSLRLVDKNKKEWVLRTIDKEAEGALPKKIRIPFVINFVQDMISASHPYAALVVSDLAQATNIIAAKPRLYFVPDDEALSPYREVFANTVCFLERREPTPDSSETESTSKIMEEIIEENDHLVLQEAVLNARLLDMLAGDWDRHADQWRWGVVDLGAPKYYYAIPRDRDQAFFWTNGLLPRFIRLFAMKHINGFRKQSKGLKRLNYKSWAFDKIFLNELDSSIWQTAIKEFQNKLTDDVIERAVKKLPKEVYAINGAMLESRLKSRRNTLLEGAMKYYRFIAGAVDISGTEEEELFEIKSNGRLLSISVYRLKENKKRDKKIYERSFDPEDTKFISLAGLGGSDQFLVEENISSSIRIKINGGEGSDIYNLNGKIRTVVYDSSSHKDEITNRSRAKVHLN
jgi:hypothetical protein